jgi:hypothetical protein
VPQQAQARVLPLARAVALLLGGHPDRAVGPARELVGRACAVFRCQSQKELRQLPEVQAILTADDGVRRECVLAPAWANIALEDVSWDHPWRQGQVHLLALVARRPAPLTLADLTWVVELAEDVDRGSVTPAWTMAALTPQFRALYAREPAATPLIARAAALTHYKEDGRRLEAISAREIDERDDVHSRTPGGPPVPADR